MWDLPGPGTEPVSPALAGRFLNTGPPGKSSILSPGLWKSFKLAGKGRESRREVGRKKGDG